MKYIKLFQEHSNYENYINDNPVLPNLSFCKNINDCHLNPKPDTRIIAILNITNAGYQSSLLTNTSGITQIELDNVVLPSVVQTYTFSTNGEHIAKFTLTDPTTIKNNTFSGAGSIDSVIIPNTVTTIENQAFCECLGLSTVLIPKSVTTIGDYNFAYCQLESVTIEAINPPILGSYAFSGNGNNFYIYVPAASVNAYKTATNWSTYASRIQAIS